MKKLILFFALIGAMAMNTTLAQKSSIKAIKQCLDSLVAPECFKRVFSYDNNGNNIQRLLNISGLLESWQKMNYTKSRYISIRTI